MRRARVPVYHYSKAIDAYILEEAISLRWKGHMVTCPMGMISDGATGAFDISSASWWFHDRLCATGKWDDGSPCTNLQASLVIGYALAREWRVFRAAYWPIATWLFGGGKARENGMW